jgi:fermentation-respiration switch protein FrsA (DUF1100 family)
VSTHRFTVTVGAADVVGVLHLPAARPAPCVVACHGMGASKDSDKYLLLGRELPAAGLALARFELLGSSLGGYVALWVASRLAAGAAVPVVTWNAPAFLRELSHADPGEPGAALVAEVERGGWAEAPAGVARLLVIQADRDEVVPPAHGRALFDRARDPRRLHVIAGADHRLSDPAHRGEALEASRRWLAAHLPDRPRERTR